MAKSTFPEGILPWPIERWTNGHENFTHRFKKNSSFKLVLPDSPLSSSDKYKATTANFQWLINYALKNNIQMRAMGNGWSFSEVAVCEGGVVDTKSLVLSFNFKDSFIAPGYLSSGHSSEDLIMVQCGMSILKIHEKLNEAGRSLKACGASNGQSIAGATATGTHGAAYGFGAVHDAIKGLHIVTGPDKHIWVEKASDPVASDDFIQWLGAEKVADDDVFNAAVVSFGNFGFIHGIMIETEPIFLLEEHKLGETAYNNTIQQAMDLSDPYLLDELLPYPKNETGKEIYHFEILVNPHDFAENDPAKGVFPRVMYKIPFEDHEPPQEDIKPLIYGDNLLGVVQTILDTLGPTLSAPLIPRMVNALIPLINKPGQTVTGTMGEIFKNTKFRGKAASAAFAINASDCTRVLKLVCEENGSTPFAGAVAFRFLKGTSALLGFTRFPATAVCELDGVDSNLSRAFFKRIWERLEAENIPFALHWGKINFFLTPQRVRNMYGDTAVDKWIECRERILSTDVRKVFSNNFMQSIGLAT